jgi:hypothetical protein
MSSFSVNNNFTRAQLARRAERLADIDRQIRDGRLTIRQMTSADIEREQARTPADHRRKGAER